MRPSVRSLVVSHDAALDARVALAGAKPPAPAGADVQDHADLVLVVPPGHFAGRAPPLGRGDRRRLARHAVAERPARVEPAAREAGLLDLQPVVRAAAAAIVCEASCVLAVSHLPPLLLL